MYAFGNDMKIIKRCEYCDTALEFVGSLGQRIVFTAHDEAFCVSGTRERVKMLQSVILSQRESYERAIEKKCRWFDQILKEHRLPSLSERSELSEIRRAMLHSEIDRSR